MRASSRRPRATRARAGTASLEVLELFPELLELALHGDDLLRDLGVVRLRRPSCSPRGPAPGRGSRAACPPGCRAASASRAAPTCARKRTSSSVMSSRSAWNAISCASRASSTGRPSSSSATAPRSRSRSRTSRSGRAAGDPLGRRAPAGRADGAARRPAPRPRAPASPGTPPPPARRSARPRPRGSRRAASPAGREHVRLPRHQLERDLARRAPAPTAARAAAPSTSRARSRSTANPPAPLGILGPARLHRHVPAVELAPQPLAQLALEHRQLAGQLGGEIEVAMVDGPDLDAEPPAGHRAFRRAEPGHAVRQTTSAGTGKAGKFSAEAGRLVGRRRRSDVSP